MFEAPVIRLGWWKGHHQEEERTKAEGPAPGRSIQRADRRGAVRFSACSASSSISRGPGNIHQRAAFAVSRLGSSWRAAVRMRPPNVMGPPIATSQFSAFSMFTLLPPALLLCPQEACEQRSPKPPLDARDSRPPVHWHVWGPETVGALHLRLGAFHYPGVIKISYWSAPASFSADSCGLLAPPSVTIWC